MYCPNCGKQIPDDTKFCNECGAPTATAESSVSASEATRREFSQEPFKSSAVDVDAFKSKGKNAIKKIMGDDYAAPAPEATYVKHPHPYHKLGGWLGFVAYVQLVAVGITSVVFLIGFFGLFGALQYLHGSDRVSAIFIYLIMLVAYAVSAFFCVKYFMMIRNKNPRFLRFYELIMIVQFAINILVLIFTGATAENIRGLISVLVGFLIWTAYYRKSVRVRTYFGSDEYLRRSIFSKNAQAPMPADMAPAQNYAVPPVVNNPAAATSLCGTCGAAIPDTAAFCPACGAKKAAD